MVLPYGRFLTLLVAACTGLAGGLGRITHAEGTDSAYGMKVGSGSRLILGLDSGISYDSNFFRQESNETSATGLFVRPSALLLTDRGNFRYELGARAEAAAYDVPGDEDDYVDGTLRGLFEWQPLTRHRFSGGAAWNFGHDTFGTRRTEALGVVDRRLDRWEQSGANLVYRFGAREATINLETELAGYDREYQTNRASTQFLDHDMASLRGSLYYRISSKTRLVAEVIGSDIEYDHVAPGFASRAGDLIRYRIGARWLASGKTTGDVRIGRVERDFDSAAQPDYDEVDWEATVMWEPRTRDKLTFSTGREPQESYVNASSIIDHAFYDLSWKHDWTSMFNSTLTLGYDELDFQGITREDDVNRVQLELEYKPTRSWALFADVTRRERDSNVAQRDFDNTAVTMGIRLTY